MNVALNNLVRGAEIPTIPDILHRILSLADNPRTTSADLEKLIAQEPALVTKLLKIVNSALYSLPYKVSSISHSMILLGFSTVKSIASGMILVNTFDNLKGIAKEYLYTVWRHSLLTANLAKILAQREATSRRDDLFLAGIIHDIGHLVLRQHFGEKYEALLQTNPFPSPDAEKEIVEFNHAEVGGALLKQWNFSDRVIALVANHHNPQGYEGDPKEINLMITAETLSNQDGLASILEQEEAAVDPALLNQIQSVGWNWTRLQREKEVILSTLRTIEEVLS